MCHCIEDRVCIPLWALGNVLPPLEAENHHLPPSWPEDRSCSTAVTAGRGAVGMETQGLLHGWMNAESKRNNGPWTLWGKRLSSFLPNLLADLLKSVCIRTLEIFICAQMTMSFSLQKALWNLNFSFTINRRLAGESWDHGLDVNSHPYTYLFEPFGLYLIALFGRIGGV